MKSSNADDIPFEWKFEKYDYHTVVGRRLLIKPLKSNNIHQAKYSWNVEEIDGLNSSDSQFIFTSDVSGEYHVTATATITDDDNNMTITRNFIVSVYDEKEFYRPKSGVSQAEWNKIFEYTPAQGQFINETKTAGFH